jgi:hypothetical protein
MYKVKHPKKEKFTLRPTHKVLRRMRELKRRGKLSEQVNACLEKYL